jgi:hypothetical protein
VKNTQREICRLKTAISLSCKDAENDAKNDATYVKGEVEREGKKHHN